MADQGEIVEKYYALHADDCLRVAPGKSGGPESICRGQYAGMRTKVRDDCSERHALIYKIVREWGPHVHAIHGEDICQWADRMVHLNQGNRFASSDWQVFLKAHHMVSSMSQRGNCHDHAMAESFFSSLKKERIKQRIYPNREQARPDVFDYIQMFYNPVRRHGSVGNLSPVEFERQFMCGYGLSESPGEKLHRAFRVCLRVYFGPGRRIGARFSCRPRTSAVIR
jgi:transposase InsO family protein